MHSTELVRLIYVPLEVCKASPFVHACPGLPRLASTLETITEARSCTISVLQVQETVGVNLRHLTLRTKHHLADIPSKTFEIRANDF